MRSFKVHVVVSRIETWLFNRDDRSLFSARLWHLPISSQCVVGRRDRRLGCETGSASWPPDRMTVIDKSKRFEFQFEFELLKTVRFSIVLKSKAWTGCTRIWCWILRWRYLTEAGPAFADIATQADRTCEKKVLAQKFVQFANKSRFQSSSPYEILSLWVVNPNFVFSNFQIVQADGLIAAFLLRM